MNTNLARVNVVSSAIEVVMEEVRDHVRSRKVPFYLYEKAKSMFVSYFLNLENMLANYHDENIERIYSRELEPLVWNFLNIIVIGAARSEELSEDDVSCITDMMEEILVLMKRIEDHLP